MRELTEEGRRLIDALIRAPLAWQSPAQLASSMASDLEATTDLVATLDADGWLAPWDRGEDVVVTLSPAAAATLCVRLVEYGPHESPRWARAGDPEPPQPRAWGVFSDTSPATLERVEDPTPPAGEAGPPKAPGRSPLDASPAPTLLIGSGLTPWPGPPDGRKASCPSCGSKALGPSAYCLYCDRWGLDHLLLERPSPRPTPPRRPEADLRRAEIDRAKRKAKRRARLLGRSK